MSTSTSKRKQSEDPLVSARHNLLSGKLPDGLSFRYIGVSGIVDDFVWVSDGRLDKLLTKAEADDLEAKRDLHRQDPKAHEAPFVDASLLAMTVHLDEKGFYLVPDAGYTGYNSMTKSLKEAKMYGTGSCPFNTPFAGDFEPALNNVKEWMMRAKVHDISKGVCGEQDTTLKFRHVPFEDLAKSTKTDDDDELPAIYKIANWPVETDAAKREIRTIDHSHRVVPLPAYDIDNNLISPDTYRVFLQRAVVSVLFTLEHRSITPRKPGNADVMKEESKPSDVYSADIINMHVLVEPTPIRSSPKKPRLQLKNPAALAPSKGKGKST